MKIFSINHLQMLQPGAILCSKGFEHPLQSGSRTVTARHDSRNFMAGALYPFTLDLQGSRKAGAALYACSNPASPFFWPSNSRRKDNSNAKNRERA